MLHIREFVVQIGFTLFHAQAQVVVATEMLTNQAQSLCDRLVDCSLQITGNILLQASNPQPLFAINDTAVGRQIPSDHFKECRFAGAVAAEQTDALALGNAQGNVL